MHASIIFTTVALAATAFAGPLLETRACPTGPYKEGSACGEDCLGALKCSDNLYDVVRTTSPFPPPVLRSFLLFSFLFAFFHPSHLKSTTKVHGTGGVYLRIMLKLHRSNAQTTHG